jgi:hypothetical protein
MMRLFSAGFAVRPVALLATLLLTACISNVQTKGGFEEGAAENITYDRVIILGLSHNAGARCDFEYFLRTQVRTAKTEAQASCNLMKTSDELTRESIEKIVEEYGADAVLVTVLVDSDIEPEEGGDSDTRGGAYFKPKGYAYETPYYRDRYGVYRGGYGVYGVPVVYGEWRLAPVITSVDGEVTIRTMFYETAGATMVYEIISTADDLSSRENALASITPPIADDLRDAGLIR